MAMERKGISNNYSPENKEVNAETKRFSLVRRTGRFVGALFIEKPVTAALLTLSMGSAALTSAGTVDATMVGLSAAITGMFICHTEGRRQS